MQDPQITPAETAPTQSPPAHTVARPTRSGINGWLAVAAIALVAGLIWFNMDLSSPAGEQSSMIRRGAQAARTAPEKGAMAPDFSLPTLDGDVIRLSDLRGKPVILNFWATWCPPCREEMPDLELIWQQYNQGDVMVLGIDQGEAPQVVEAFIQQTVGTTFPILLDPRQAVGRDLYWVRSLPTTFFIDPDGIIQEIYVGGPLRVDFLQARVQQLQMK
jgi:peroxiredoxin